MINMQISESISLSNMKKNPGLGIVEHVKHENTMCIYDYILFSKTTDKHITMLYKPLKSRDTLINLPSHEYEIIYTKMSFTRFDKYLDLICFHIIIIKLLNPPFHISVTPFSPCTLNLKYGFYKNSNLMH